MPASQILKQRRILVVDDVLSMRFLVRGILESAGATVRMATNGQECLEKVEAEMLDLVILDIVMEGLDGWETLRRLRTLPGNEMLPVIILTAQGMPGDVRAPVDLDHAALLSKPFSPTGLIQKASDLIEARSRAQNGKDGR